MNAEQKSIEQKTADLENLAKQIDELRAKLAICEQSLGYRSEKAITQGVSQGRDALYSMKRKVGSYGRRTGSPITMKDIGGARTAVTQKVAQIMGSPQGRQKSPPM